MDAQAARHAVITAREAWHKAIDARNRQWTPAAHNEEWRTIRRLESAIKDLQVFEPYYDPKARRLYAYLDDEILPDC
jgi:hypothetical protein